MRRLEWTRRCFGDATHGEIAAGAETVTPCAIDVAATRANWRKLAAEHNQQAEQRCNTSWGEHGCGSSGVPYDDPEGPPPPSASLFVATGSCIEHQRPVPDTPTRPTAPASPVPDVPSRLSVAPSPVFMPGIEDAVDVQVGGTVTCVLRKTGAIRCWGEPQGFRLDSTGTPHCAPPARGPEAPDRNGAPGSPSRAQPAPGRVERRAESGMGTADPRGVLQHARELRLALVAVASEPTMTDDRLEGSTMTSAMARRARRSRAP